MHQCLLPRLCYLCTWQARQCGQPDSEVLLTCNSNRHNHLLFLSLQLIGKQSYSQNNATLLGVVLNKVNPKEHSIISQQVKSKVQADDFAFAGAIPFNPLLNTVR